MLSNTLSQSLYILYNILVTYCFIWALFIVPSVVHGITVVQLNESSIVVQWMKPLESNGIVRGEVIY